MTTLIGGISRRTFLKTAGATVAGVAGLGYGPRRGRAQYNRATYLGTAVVSLADAGDSYGTPTTYEQAVQVVARQPLPGETNALNIAMATDQTTLGQPGNFVVSTAAQYGEQFFQFWTVQPTAEGGFDGTLTDRHEGELPQVNIVIVDAGSTESYSDGTVAVKEMGDGSRMAGTFSTDGNSVSAVVQGLTSDETTTFDIQVNATRNA